MSRLQLLLITAGFAACLCVSAQARAAEPVQVFILAGQSNMVGHGKTLNGLNPDYDDTQPQGPGNWREIPGGIGSLTWAVDTMPAIYGHGGTTPLVDSNGDWLVRSDVNVYARMEYFEGDPVGSGTTRSGNHTVGFGKANSSTQKWNGPEYGMGMQLGNALSKDVLIIKVATGGTDLAEKWRSPTAVANRGGTVGYMWDHMLSTVNGVLDNLDTEFTEYTGRTYEVAGFGWHQGFNDHVNAPFAAEYQANLIDLLTDVRSEYGAALPVVIGTTSMFPPDPSGPVNTVELAQLAVGDADPLTTTIYTGDFWRGSDESPSTFGFHWNHNGLTHLDIGLAMGDAMVDLIIPEPGTIALLGLGGAVLLGRRQRSTKHQGIKSRRRQEVR